MLHRFVILVSTCITMHLCADITTSLTHLTRSLNEVVQNLTTQTPQKLQDMPPSSILYELSQGKSVSRKEKIDLFKQDCNQQKNQNKIIPVKNNNILRIMTYNVHMWLTPDFQDNVDVVKNIIDELKPDIFTLQEASITPLLQKMLQDFGYEYIFCQSQGFVSRGMQFGNVLAYKAASFTSIDKKFSKDYKEKYLEGRCYTAITLGLSNGKKLSVYGTHLDVYNHQGTVREEQLKELVTDIAALDDNNIIVAGDFNAVRKQDYEYVIHHKSAWDLVFEEYKKVFNIEMSTKELEVLQQNGFRDCFAVANLMGPKFTVWTGTVVDFIFLNAAWNLPISGCYVYYTAASDHIPVIMDIAFEV